VLGVLFIAMAVSGAGAVAFTSNSDTIASAMYNKLFEQVAEINKTTVKIAKDTGKILDTVTVISKNTTNLKKETSDNPRKELQNSGVEWSGNSFMEQLEIGDLENIKLFFEGNIAFDIQVNDTYPFYQYMLAKTINYGEILKLASMYGFDSNESIQFDFFSFFTEKNIKKLKHIEQTPIPFYYTSNFQQFIKEKQLSFAELFIFYNNDIKKENIDILIASGANINDMKKINIKKIELLKNDQIPALRNKIIEENLHSEVASWERKKAEALVFREDTKTRLGESWESQKRSIEESWNSLVKTYDSKLLAKMYRTKEDYLKQFSSAQPKDKYYYFHYQMGTDEKFHATWDKKHPHKLELQLLRDKGKSYKFGTAHIYFDSDYNLKKYRKNEIARREKLQKLFD